MKLSEYPQAIAKLQYEILSFDQTIISLTESVKVFEAEIDKAIAFDSKCEKRRAAQS